MTSTPHETFATFLRNYIDEGYEGPASVEDVWDRYNAPDAVHVLDQKTLHRADSIDRLQAWRRRESPFDLRVHSVVSDGRHAAAHVSISSALMWRLVSETEYTTFCTLTEDGRIASSTTMSKPGYGWRSGEGVWDDDAVSHDVEILSGDGTTPADDVARYLEEYTTLSGQEDLSAAEVFDRFHSPDCVETTNGRTRSRSSIVDAIADGRAKGVTYRVEVHATVREGRRYAARYSMHPAEKKVGRPELEVIELGSFADDGRVREVRSSVQTLHGARL